MSAAPASPSPQAAAALAGAAEQGIHCLPIPTPFAVGRVNVYLIDDDPLTLVDTGPNSGTSLDELERALAEHGRAIEDLRLLLITHQHMDHLGLAEILARRSGAEVATLDGLAPYIEAFADDAELDDRFAELLMRRHGVPVDVTRALRAVTQAVRGWGSHARVTRRLADGETLSLADRELRVLHRPGHSPTDTVFFDERRRILLGGDHLIAHISSNPLITRPPRAEPEEAAAGGRPKALVTYIESLRATRALALDTVLAGHGEPVTDHVALIDERLAMHARRAERIRELLAQRPRTAYEVAQELWGNVALTQAFLTISEVLGHVDLLLDDGAARELLDGDVVRFAAS